MNATEFKAQYLCLFQADERQVELDKKVSDYFDLSDSNVNNRVVIQAKKELLEWIRLSGYSKEEYRASRKRCQAVHR